MTFSVNLAQIDIKLGDVDHNLKKAVKIIEKHEDLIIFPEMFCSGFDYGNIMKIAEKCEKILNTIKKFSRDKTVAFSTAELSEGVIYNTLFLIEDFEIIAKYRKIHVFFDERKHIKAGRKPVVVKTEYGMVGLAICYDIRFPELFRILTKKGAELFIVVANFPKRRIDHWNVLTRARAIENLAYVFACNRIGNDLMEEYNGYSKVVDPWGRILIDAGEKEGVFSTKADPNLVKKIRKEYRFLDDACLI